MNRLKVWLKAAQESFLEVPRHTRLGVVGVVTTFVAVAGLSAITLPWSGSVDSYGHLDYVYQISKRQLPEAHGFAYEHIAEVLVTSINEEVKRHPTAAHPPLHYALLSVFMAHHLDAGDWQTAVKIGRTLNIFIGTLCVLALAWAGWRLGGRWRAQLAVALPALAGLLIPFIKVTADIYNEPLVVLSSIVVLTTTCLVLKGGLTNRRLVAIGLFAVIGMATKATFIATLGLSLLGVMAGSIIHRKSKDGSSHALVKGATACLGVLAAVALSIGWFYYRNYLQSGSWFRAAPKVPIYDRHHQTLIDNLTNIDYYLVLPGRLFGIRQWEGVLPVNMQLSLLLVLVSLLGLAYLFYKNQRSPRESLVERVSFPVVAILILQVIALYMIQLQHATGWGLLNPRYFLTGLLPIGLFLAIGLLSWQKLRGMAVVGFAILLTVGNIINSAWFLGSIGTYRTSIAPGESAWLRMILATEQNGVPIPVIFLLISVMTLGLTFVAVSLFTLTQDNSQRKTI